MTIYLVCAMVMVFLMDWLGAGFGCAEPFFFWSLWISMLSKVILIFMGLPPNPS